MPLVSVACEKHGVRTPVERATTMGQKFQATIERRGEASYVKLAGVIDEDNQLAELVDRIPAGTAYIDLGDIERINSCGVRDWVNWLGKLDTGGARSVLVECSPAIVAQINLVNNFTGNGFVKSFYVPYFCPECDEEKVLLVEAVEMGPPPHEPPTCRCDECDLVMDFDDMPDSYFAFLANARTIADGAPNKSTAKIKARVATIPAPASGSKPSVPSLPSIGKGSVPGRSSISASQLAQHQAAYQAHAQRRGITVPGVAASGGVSGAAAPSDGKAKHTVVYALIALLVIALAVLSYLVLSR